MKESDILALGTIMEHSDVPLVDVGKFPFFGGKDCHAWTDSLTTFASPSLARDLSSKWSYLAGLLKLYNDEFNAGLVNPKLKDFFKKKPLTPEEKGRYDAYVHPFDYKSADSVQLFCDQICKDESIYNKLPE